MADSSYVGLPIAPAMVRTIRDPQRGLQTVLVYEGTQAEIDGVIAGVLPDQRWEHEPTGDGMYRLTVHTPDAESAPYDTQDTWELLSNRVEKDLYEHPRSKAIHQNNITALRKWMKDPIANSTPAFSDGGTSAEAELLWNLLLKGTTKFTTAEYALRYSVTCSTRAAVVASFSNVEKLFTPAQLATPGISGITVPAGIGFSIGEIPAKTAPTGYLWSWLKTTPTIRSAPNGKIVIAQEWWLDLWSTYIYETVS